MLFSFTSDLQCNIYTSCRGLNLHGATFALCSSVPSNAPNYRYPSPTKKKPRRKRKLQGIGRNILTSKKQKQDKKGL